MKTLTIAALVAAQIVVAAQPAAAAELIDEGGVTARQRGTFAGARLRVPLGGRDGGKARASLSVAPTERSRLAGGGERTRFGEGVELSLAAGEPVALRLGGASLSERLAAAEEGKGKKDSTGKKVLKGAIIIGIVGAAVVGGLILFFVVACDDGRCSE
jgi:hypothetical protein